MQQKIRRFYQEKYADRVVAPVQTRQCGRLFLHIYCFRGAVHYRLSYSKDGALPAKDLIKHSVLLVDAAATIGAALYVLTEGRNLLRLNKRTALRYLDTDALQTVINAAFEPSEVSFAKLAERYRDKCDQHYRRRRRYGFGRKGKKEKDDGNGGAGGSSADGGGV